MQSSYELKLIIYFVCTQLSNFCNDNGGGQVCVNSAPNGCPAPGASQTDCCLVCSTVDSANTLDFPPYAISNIKGKLATKTVAMSAKHYGNITEYDSHNLYGLTEQIATAAALTEVYFTHVCVIFYLFCHYFHPLYRRSEAKDHFFYHEAASLLPVFILLSGVVIMELLGMI